MKSSIVSLPKRKADFVEPMECAPVSKLLDGAGWLYEIKLDGYRAIAVKSGRVNLFSRRHKSFNSQYPHLVEALSELPEGTVVEGEVVALDDLGRPHFDLLQNLRSEASRIHYFIFDLLICKDRDVTRLPLSERRELMKSVLKPCSPLVRIAEQFDATANDMIAAVRQQQLEGVVGKCKDSFKPGYRTSLTMPTLSSPFLNFSEFLFTPFSFFAHTTPFAPKSGLVRFFISASTTTARS